MRQRGSCLPLPAPLPSSKLILCTTYAASHLPFCFIHIFIYLFSLSLFLPLQANGGGDGGVKSIVNKQYNSPVGIYSDESIAETLSAQAEVLAGGVLG